MGLTGVLLETSTASTTSIPQLSSVSSDSFGDMAADVGSNGSELLGASCVGSSITASVDASSDDPMGILIIFKDTTPYSHTENRANHFYQQLKKKQSNTDFPVIICENKDAVCAMKSVFGKCERAKMVDTLNLLEKIIGGECDA